MRFARACLCLVLYPTLALVRCFLASCARTSTFRYNFVLPLLQQVRSHCKRSRIAVGSCSILYKNIRETIKTSYCSKTGCPAQGFIDFPLVLQDVIDVEIDHQNYSIDFSDLDIKTACKTYKIHGEACVRFETEINEYQNYVFVHKKEYKVEMMNQYTFTASAACCNFFCAFLLLCSAEPANPWMLYTSVFTVLISSFIVGVIVEAKDSKATTLSVRI